MEHIWHITIFGVIVNIILVYFNRRLFLWNRIQTWTIIVLVSAIPFIMCTIICALKKGK